MRRALPILVFAVLLGSCKSPPQPPTVDESTKRPVNSAAAVQLQACRSDLHNTRLLMNESLRSEEAARALATQLEARRVALERTTGGHEGRNIVYSIPFAFGSTRLDVRDASTARLIDQARSAPLVLLRGRTDGNSASAAENRVARERAAAVQAWLVAAGVKPTQIRTTWQPVGDHAADNTLSAGRTLNRRVEVEIYRAAPEILALDQPADHDTRQAAQPAASTPSEGNHGR